MAFGLLLVISGCSGDPGENDGSRPIPASSVDNGGSSSETGALVAEVPDGTAETIDQLEQQWEADRLDLVTALSAEPFGRDGRVLSGPGDLAVDLGSCPSDWPDAVAVEEPLMIAQIGSGEDFGLLGDGMGAYFDYVNRSGGINGRQIDFVAIDDQRTPTKTIEAVEDLQRQSQPLAITTFGTASSQAVFDLLNGQCIPQPFVGSAHPAWGDPESHPWTTGFEMSYATEATLWGNWIKRNLGGDLPVTVAALTIDNDFGRAYLAAFSAWAARNSDVVTEVVSASHAPAATDVGEVVTEMAAATPEVVLVLTAGDACSAALEGVGQATSIAARATFITSACSDPNDHLVPVGLVADDVLSVESPMKATNDPLHAEDPFAAFINDLLAGADIDDQGGLAGIGAGQYAWTYVEALRVAAELEGGISRSNLLLALRSLKLRHPLLDGGVSFSMNGIDDGFYIEGGRMRRFSAGLGAWEAESLVVDINGSTPNCAWNGEVCS